MHTNLQSRCYVTLISSVDCMVVRKTLGQYKATQTAQSSCSCSVCGALPGGGMWLAGDSYLYSHLAAVSASGRRRRRPVDWPSDSWRNNLLLYLTTCLCIFLSQNKKNKI